ncbi:uncharacterized protein LOC119572078 [Penaeus monodon]|uniref:uncharacterized protein LOC119572078 n=1 Tax=Penaeus monodon TaxID=6687 RepID=UPI0018A78C0D|nr:uncharacterized protein LOC119572078 [Penaeus monodon]
MEECGSPFWPFSALPRKGAVVGQKSSETPGGLNVARGAPTTESHMNVIPLLNRERNGRRSCPLGEPESCPPGKMSEELPSGRPEEPPARENARTTCPGARRAARQGVRGAKGGLGYAFNTSLGGDARPKGFGAFGLPGELPARKCRGSCCPGACPGECCRGMPQECLPRKARGVPAQGMRGNACRRQRRAPAEGKPGKLSGVEGVGFKPAYGKQKGFPSGFSVTNHILRSLK